MDSTIPRSWRVDPGIRREDLYGFQESAEQFFAGEIKRAQFAEVARRFGILPSREDDALLLHIPLPGGLISEKIDVFLRRALKGHSQEDPIQVSFSTAPGLWLHALQLSDVCELLDLAFETGILPGTQPPAKQPCAKSGDGGTITHPRINPQGDTGLYRVLYHPIAGYLEAGEFLKLLDAAGEIEDASVRMTQGQELWLDNLTSDEAEQLLNVTGSSAQTPFERSLLILEDTLDEPEPALKEVVEDSIRAVYRAQIPEEALPQLIVTDLPVTQGKAPELEGVLLKEGQLLLTGQEDEDDQHFCRLYLARADRDGLSMQELITLSDEQVSVLLTQLGREIASEAADYAAWRRETPEGLETLIRAFTQD